MPRIRKKGTASGPLGVFADRVVYTVGDDVGQVPAATAQAWVECGAAEYLADAVAAPVVEKADAPEVKETANADPNQGRKARRPR